MLTSHENSKGSAKRANHLTNDPGKGSSPEMSLLQAAHHHLKDLQSDLAKLAMAFKSSSVSDEVDALNDTFFYFESVLSMCADKATSRKTKIPVVTEYLGREYILSFPGVSKGSPEYSLMIDRLFEKFKLIPRDVLKYGQCLNGTAVFVNISDTADINNILSLLNFTRP